MLTKQEFIMESWVNPEVYSRYAEAYFDEHETEDYTILDVQIWAEVEHETDFDRAYEYYVENHPDFSGS